MIPPDPNWILAPDCVWWDSSNSSTTTATVTCNNVNTLATTSGLNTSMGTMLPADYWQKAQAATVKWVSTTTPLKPFGGRPHTALQPGETRELPDGSKIIIDDQGNYRIEDKDAQVTYQANRMREFSPYLNASDMLTRFMDYVRGLGVKQHEVLQLPLELFVNWLIIEAAERDQDPVPEGVVRPEEHKLLAAVTKPKCLRCGKFIPKTHRQYNFPFCDPPHAADYILKRREEQNETQEDRRP